MTEKRDELEEARKTDFREKTEINEQELFIEEMNKKLFAELSDIFEEQTGKAEAEKEDASEKDVLEEKILNEEASEEKIAEEEISKEEISEEVILKGEVSKKKDSKKEIPQKKASKKQISKKKRSKKKHGPGKYFRIVITVLLGIILFIAVLSACAVGIYWKGKSHMTSASGIKFQIPEGVTATSSNNGKTVTYENKDYQRRTGTTNILMIGKNSDHTFSTVVVNFDGASKSLLYIPVPASLLAIDYSSAMDYSDIADYVSEFLCGLPIQGYMVLDMQVVDTLLETETEQVMDNLQMQKLTVFAGEVVDNASENWMIPSKIFEEFQDSFKTDLDVADLSYVYSLLIVCSDSAEYEFVEPMDTDAVFRQLLDTFYNEKQE